MIDEFTILGTYRPQMIHAVMLPSPKNMAALELDYSSHSILFMLPPTPKGIDLSTSKNEFPHIYLARVYLP